MRSFEGTYAEGFGEVSWEEARQAEAFFESLRGESDLGAGEAVAVDTRAAIPAFLPSVKARIMTPLIDGLRLSSAVKWNNANHPRKSGVTTAEIRGALGGYVDIAAVASRAHVAASSDEALAIALHQFQMKCFAEAHQINGRGQESTLDSLGLVARSGMHSFNHENKKRRAYLRTPWRSAKIRKLSGGEFSGHRWFKFMVNPSFLGQTFYTVSGTHPIGIHLHFVRRARVAEKYLQSLPAYANKTPVEVGAALGIDERHRGARPWNKKSESIHTLGLAADITKAKAPWITHPKSSGTPKFIAIQERASWLASGWRGKVTAAYLHRLGDSGKSTASIYDELKKRSDELVQYLALGSDPAALATAVAARSSGGPSGSPTTVAGWTTQISADLRALRSGANFGSTRNPHRGWIGHHKDLVIALRDAACMAWGAVDFGASYSGDVMHFDVRRTPLGKLLNKVGYQPKVPCPTMPTPASPPATPVTPTSKGALRDFDPPRPEPDHGGFDFWNLDLPGPFSW